MHPQSRDQSLFLRSGSAMRRRADAHIPSVKSSARLQFPKAQVAERPAMTAEQMRITC
jgi:hypothetical protein